ncbi:methyltransferase type 11 [Coprinopsis marcescibilis]|uniref:Methyltransferase type 11 n=1 Tax=Coprinopsis marcescibilis TaxID=230819 RepID=A0A5C3LDI5_COPMA|nr:methyltransferase type 11 [Coprinopsis marcescibilis]
MPKVHEVAQLGFGEGTNELYDRIRPTYQPWALSYIREFVDGQGLLNIAEIGSGTGIFTRAILAHPEWTNSIKGLWAVEPSEGMRKTFSDRVNDTRVSVVDGTFDATGIPDGWADIVIVAQAFHWCPDYDKAATEFDRILKPEGSVVFIWNLEDRDADEWAGQVRDLIEVHEQGTPQFRLGLWRQVFDTASYKAGFQTPVEKTWSYHIPGTEEATVQRASSKSYIAVTYARTDELSVTFYATLPIEVKQVLRNSDFYKTSYMGGIDTTTGFAVVASSRTCFVWQHSQAIKGVPTCYIFHCPTETDNVHPPFHVLVPKGISEEPGLVLLSHSGQIRFWESIGIGLAGGDNFATMYLELGEEEHVTNLERVDSQLFVASTSNGNLFRLNLTSTGGKYHLTSRKFSRPPAARTLSSLLPSFLGSSSSILNDGGRGPQYIRSIAATDPSETGERNIWVLGEERIQKWVMRPEGWEEKTLDESVTSSIQRVVENSPDARADNLDLELLDLAIDDSEKFVVLVSFAGREDVRGMKRLYALVQLVLVGNYFGVSCVKYVPYQNTSAPSAPVAPRIQLLFYGQLVSVEFGDAVAFCSLDSDYQDRIQLKSTADRTLGVGVAQGTSTLLVMTATTMMQVQLFMDKIQTFDEDTGRTNLIKSILMQAILYGSSPENPLHFSFPPHIDEESLMRGAEQLSYAVLQSGKDALPRRILYPEIVRRNHDLTAQLTSRKERLSWLIGFINENLVLGKISQRSRQRLAVDAEKLYACYQLWIQYNDLLATAPKFTVLNDTVHAYMASLGENQHEDVMRAFFRLKVSDVGNLIRKVYEVAKLSSKQTGRDMAILLPEANRIVVTALRSAFEYRAHNFQVYGIELPMMSSWTSRPKTADVVLDLFNATRVVLEKALVENPGSAPNHHEPGSQLPDLAALFFECVSERLEWLSSPKAAEEANVVQDKEELSQYFASLRPGMLETLRRTGHQAAAFALAEQYQDFESLVALCHRETIYPPENNPNFERIQAYIARYKESFTDELYQWYIQHSELRTMFSQEHEQSAFIDRFFAKKPNPGISWLHEVANKRYGTASSDLLEEAGRANQLEVKHLMLSLGKLSALAQLHETGEVVEQPLLDAFHDQLDFVSVHDYLLTEFKSALESVRGRHSLESQVETIVNAKAVSLKEKKALAKCFKDLLKHLLQGRALSIEDAVDLLTLKDNGGTIGDYATALHLLYSATNVPEARKTSAYRTVWRRVYLHDDWKAIGKTANVTDAEITDRLKSTALYETLCAIQGRKLQGRPPPGYDTSPEYALMIPTAIEIASRWSGLSQEQLEAIGQDYTLESDQLGDLELDDIYLRVRELAAQDPRCYADYRILNNHVNDL